MFNNKELNEVIWNYQNRRGIFRYRVYPKTNDTLKAHNLIRTYRFNGESSKTLKEETVIVEDEAFFNSYFQIESHKLLIADCLLCYPEAFSFLGNRAILFDNITFNPAETLDKTLQVLEVIQNIPTKAPEDKNTKYINKELNLMNTELNKLIVNCQNRKGLFRSRYASCIYTKQYDQDMGNLSILGNESLEDTNFLKTLRLNYDAEQLLVDTLSAYWLHVFVITECLLSYPHLFETISKPNKLLSDLLHAKPDETKIPLIDPLMKTLLQIEFDLHKPLRA